MNRGLIGGIAGLAVVIIAVAVILLVSGGEDEPAIEGVETFSGYEGGVHVTDPVTYDQTPPVGGQHFPYWLKCGVYDTPVPNEAAVHDLEHGVVWFAYDADTLDADQVATLAGELPDVGIMSPYPGLDSPVVLTSWERQLRLDSVDDPRIQEFVDAYESGPLAPERTVGCSSGYTLEQLEAEGVPAAPAS